MSDFVDSMATQGKSMEKIQADRWSKTNHRPIFLGNICLVKIRFLMLNCSILMKAVFIYRKCFETYQVQIIQ